MKLRQLGLAGILLLPLVATAQEDPQKLWEGQLVSAQRTLRMGNQDEAKALLGSVREAALQAGNNAITLKADRLLLFVYRAQGDWSSAQSTLEEALRLTPEYEQIARANLLDELGAAQRASGKLEEALATFRKALDLRSRYGYGPEVARDLTITGLLGLDLKKRDEAKQDFIAAVEVWAQLLRDDPETLVATESLAQLYRDDSNYSEAEPLYERSLRIREMSFGANSAELIVGLDNLAYCYFGNRKYDKAEPLYKRLLEVWVNTAGPDHPMVALTLDKIVTFYSEQKRYEEAQPLADRAIQIRGKALVDSFRTRSSIAAFRMENEAALAYVDKATTTRELAGLPKPAQKLLPAPKDAVPVKPSKAPAKRSLSNTK